MGLVLTLSAAFGLMACGDDSNSSSSTGASSDPKSEQEQFKKDCMEQHAKLGQCSKKNQGEKKQVTILNQKYTVVCGPDEDDEYGWQNEELDKLAEKYFDDEKDDGKKDDSKKSDDSKKDDGKKQSGSKDEIQVNSKCKVNVDDNSVTMTASTPYQEIIVQTSLKDGKVVTKTTSNYKSSSQAKIDCNEFKDNGYDNVKCEDKSVSYSETVDGTKVTIDELKKTAISVCKIYEDDSDNFDDDDEDDDDDNDKFEDNREFDFDENGYLILNKGDEIPSCYGQLVGVTVKWPSGSWMKCEMDEKYGGTSWENASDPYAGKVEEEAPRCAFEKDDNEWVINETSMTSKQTIVYKFSKNSYTITTTQSQLLGASTCEIVLDYYEGSKCDGDFLVLPPSTEEFEFSEDETKDDIFDSVQEDYCQD